MIEYSGKLVLIYETGFEGCHMAALHDDRGITKNAKYDSKSTKWPECVPEFFSWEWTINYKKNDHLTIWAPDKSLVYDGILGKDREAIAKHKYTVDFIPFKVDFLEWVYWHKAEYRARLVRVMGEK